VSVSACARWCSRQPIHHKTQPFPKVVATRASSLVLHLVRAFTVLASRMCRVPIPPSHGLTQFVEVLLEILNDCFFGHDGCLLRPFLSFPIPYVGLDVQLL